MMDDVYDVLGGPSTGPTRSTNGLRRTLDAYRAVLERTRGDVTTTGSNSGFRNRWIAGYHDAALRGCSSVGRAQQSHC